MRDDGPAGGRFRYGVLGTGRIATKFANALTSSARCDVVRVGSRTPAKANAFAAGLAAPPATGDYDALLADDAVDAVYVALPPSLHREWTERAAAAGKHVLCEKPLAPTGDDADAMADACRRHGVRLNDAVMWRHAPRAALMRDCLDAADFGPIRRVVSSFTFPGLERFSSDEFRMDRNRGGGALLDLGYYNVALSVWAVGETPVRARCDATFRDGVDIAATGTLWFAGGAIATFDCGFDALRRNWFEVASDARSLVNDDFARPWKPDKHRFWTHDTDGNATQHAAEPADQIVALAEAFADAAAAGRDLPTLAEAVATQRVLDALFRSAASGRVEDVARTAGVRG
ncbi:MAG: Gfo/Idh/MocA family oxidoreductase, partial [Planctomycetota bacterium]